MKEDNHSLVLPCIQVTQPIGTFFLASIKARDLCKISHADIRRMLREREIETYLGIQRPLDKKRVDEIGKYVNTVDACFPTAVILAVDGKCASFNPDTRELTLSNYVDAEDEEENILFIQIAKVLDGQHRIEGLKALAPEQDFEVNVSIFVDCDIANQAYIFSTVNLAQTKVNRSLAIDLFEVARARSPQKTCHNIAVALDKRPDSPFYKRIKRLGVATEGRDYEMLTQATFVDAVMKYINNRSGILEDRDLYLRGKKPARASADQLRKFIFRNMFIDDRDLEITDVLWNYFDAVRKKWQSSWGYTGTGQMLNRTNGFIALMKFLKPAYLSLTSPGGVPSEAEFSSIFKKIQIEDLDFTTDNFPPGSTGQSALYRALIEQSGIRE